MKRTTSSTDLQEDTARKLWEQQREKHGLSTVKNSVKHARLPQESFTRVWKQWGCEMNDPATIINDTNGEALHEEEKIMQRGENYFKDLLNPSGVRAQGTQSRFNPSHPDHSEPTILESEVRKVVKTSPKGKAAGDDGITTEVINVCGEPESSGSRPTSRKLGRREEYQKTGKKQ